MPEKNNRASFEQEVRLRVYKDPTFRKQLLADPRATTMKVASELKMDPKIFQTYKQIHIHEEKADELSISIPAARKNEQQGSADSQRVGDACTTSCPTDYTGFCPVATC